MSPDRVPIELSEIARLPAPGDNAAVATRRLESGTVVRDAGREFELPHTVLEGHRFVVAPIANGAELTSWGLPFGTATRDLVPGEYVCNERIMAALAGRDIDFELPASANFSDVLQRHVFDEATFVPGRQVTPVATPGTFEGFRRPGRRGVGTRNHVIVLATSSRANAFATQLARRFGDATGFDGVVAVTHTEGGTESEPHNRELVLRTLAGFMVHPNVGAALAVDHAGPRDTNVALRHYLAEHGYAAADVPHDFVSLEGDHAAELDRATAIVGRWLPAVAATARSTAPLSELKVALQCGGSDAFSGVSGNALAGWVGKLLIRHGGSIAIAETDELMGAEAYVLRNVRDAGTARRLIEVIERFKARIRLHGATPEGNPSGGNNYRGLYNIALKSLGAARKFDPEVRLDHVIDYAEPMTGPGCYFVDSPGNDLESIAGEVAAGCNLIFFTTGNGSITNFPFVPTLKFVTTTGRFEMLADEMDVNAGRYNDGEEMSDLGDEVFALARAVADGQRTKGERAGHSQVQIWRDWQQVDPAGLERVRGMAAPDGRPLDVLPAAPSGMRFEAFETTAGPALDRVALVMPTSLCSGQVARIIAEELGAQLPEDAPVTRYVSLVHTEGCGSTNTNDVFLRTLLGHLRHPFVEVGLLLEHGCEQTHNDMVRGYLVEHGLDATDYGWASIQLDGGLQNVGAKVATWFGDALAHRGPAPRVQVGADALSLALVAEGHVPDHAAAALATLAAGVVAARGTVVVPSSGPLARSATFRERLLHPDGEWRTTLEYGQRFGQPGLHVMDAPTTHATETITGLGATGAQMVVAHIEGVPVHAHPMIPTVQVSGNRGGANVDLALGTGDAELAVAELERLIEATASRRYVPRLVDIGLVDFQLTRGRLGVSM
jgi:altronate dehydratase